MLIPHVDDLGVTRGANVSMVELFDVGLVTSGSAMVPAPWFADLARIARDRPDLDIGIHLTLTSESAACRWGPVSTRSHASGLIDGDGYLWQTVAEVLTHADPAAVEEELRTQIERALEAGIDVTHLDHHMGTAIAPEYAAITARLGEECGIPVMFPRSVMDYFTVLHMGASDVATVENVRNAAGSALVVDFLIGMEHRDEDITELYRRYVAGAGDGPTFLSLHCNRPGEIEAVHPNDAAWRIAEDTLFRDAEFIEWVNDQDVELATFRTAADRLGSR